MTQQEQILEQLSTYATLLQNVTQQRDTTQALQVDQQDAVYRSLNHMAEAIHALAASIGGLSQVIRTTCDCAEDDDEDDEILLREP